MVLNFDTSRAPLRDSDYVELVRAVASAREGDESHWLEWKSTLELGSPEGKAAVARCVTAMANRAPEVASRFCEGRGYMVIGAAPGRINGVAERDPADLTNWWTPYLGVDGPRWVPHWVALDDSTVLVIEVAAPQPGDPPFAICKETTGVRDGDVYVRRAGTSARATSRELAQLVERASARERLTGLSVSVASPEPLRPVNFSYDSIEAWVTAVRDECLSSLPRADKPGDRSSRQPRRFESRPREAGDLSLAELEELEQRQTAGEGLDEVQNAQLAEAHAHIKSAMGDLLSNLFSTEPEHRTHSQYTLEVEAHLDELRRALPAELRAGAAALLTPSTFVLTNETATNLPDVRLVVYLEAACGAVEPDEEQPGLPTPPRPFGPRRIDRFGIGRGIDIASIPGLSAGFVPRLAGVDIENGGSTTLRFRPVHLRPYDMVALSEVVLLLPPGDSIGTWAATSTGLDGVARGTLTLTTTGEPLEVAAALAPSHEEE